MQPSRLAGILSRRLHTLIQLPRKVDHLMTTIADLETALTTLEDHVTTALANRETPAPSPDPGLQALADHIAAIDAQVTADTGPKTSMSAPPADPAPQPPTPTPAVSTTPSAPLLPPS